MAEIISFYSFKGGVGRSMTLANVAALLAAQQARVVCIDFDLEAGGLHTIFGVEPRDIKYTLLDMLTSIRIPDIDLGMVNLSSLLGSKGGELWLLPTISETDKVLKVLDATRDVMMLLGGILDAVIERHNPHFILIDSRSGFAELANASILKAERLVCVLRPNRQNADGLRLLLDILATLPERRPSFLVLSQVPDVPAAEERIQALRGLLGPGRDFGARIPYIPQLALEESVIALTAPNSGFARCYEPIARWLKDGV